MRFVCHPLVHNERDLRASYISKTKNLLKPHLLLLLFSLHFLSLSRENHTQTTMPSSITSISSSSSFSTSSFTCFSATSPSNLQRFLQCVTPRVPSQILPKVILSFILIYISIFILCVLFLWVVFKFHSLSSGLFLFVPIHLTVRLFVHFCSYILYIFLISAITICRIWEYFFWIFLQFLYCSLFSWIFYLNESLGGEIIFNSYKMSTKCHWSRFAQ